MIRTKLKYMIFVVIFIGITLSVCASCASWNIKEVKLGEGDKIDWNQEECTISLVENGTTGYLWDVQTNLSLAVNEPESINTGQLVGAAGKRKIVIKGQDNSTNSILLRYQRSWEKTPVKEYNIQLVIEDNKIKDVINIDANSNSN